jgi:hypothetical protein
MISASVSEISQPEYLRRVESSSLPLSIKKRLYSFISRHDLQGILTHQTTFLHFGTLNEFPVACRSIHQQNLRTFYSVYNRNHEIKPVLTARSIMHNCNNVTFKKTSPDDSALLEGCINVDAALSANNVLMGVSDFEIHATVPPGFCIDERTIDDRTVRAVYHCDDTFKPLAPNGEVIFCGDGIDQWLKQRTLKLSDVIPEGNGKDLYSAKLFAAEMDSEFLLGYWCVPRSITDWSARFISATRFSLEELNANCDLLERDKKRAETRQSILRNQIMAGKGWAGISQPDFNVTFKEEDLEQLSAQLQKTDDPFLYQYRETLFKSIGSSHSPTGDSGISRALHFRAAVPINRRLSIGVKKDQIVSARCPLRFDVAGGWTDTPPYTNRYGGEVVNVAVDLNDQSPVQVFIRATKELHIRAHSIDLGLTETFNRTEQIRDFKNPNSAFSLPKAALCLLGLVSENATKNDFIEQLLEPLGCGIDISLHCAVPKGSGPGTSSVLGATILAALQRFFGITTTQNELFLHVLEMEQMLTTGGGWQDQIGGVAAA